MCRANSDASLLAGNSEGTSEPRVIIVVLITRFIIGVTCLASIVVNATRQDCIE